MPPLDPSLTLSADYRVDDVCRRVEAAWKAGQTPRLEDHLGEAEGAERRSLLWELLRLELEYRRKRGETPVEGEYTRRFPDLPDLMRRLFESARASAFSTPTCAVTVGFSGGEQETPAGPLDVAVPGYDILAEVGRGGMGVVYKAHHLALNRDVALKMILAGSHAGPLQIIRFRQEAETVARLEHPNVIKIYEVGYHQGQSYLALEYIAGGTLAGKTAGVRQPARDAARLVATLASAVQHAHGRGVVHRDLKPANILLTSDGVPKITDFGLARLLGQTGGGLTVTNAILGTPGYMAPEQAEGRNDIGPAADVYALGAILYELLTGRPPFQGTNVADVLRRMTVEEVVPVRRLRGDCPRDLETICLKCLQKDPARRYPTADGLADDLHRFLADEPIRARPVGRAEQFARWCRRNPRVAFLTGLTALLLVVIAAGGVGLSLRLKKSLDEAEQAVRDGKDKQFQSEVSLAKANRLSRRMGQRFETLTAIRRAVALAQELEKPPETFDELRNLAIAALALPDLWPTPDWVGRPTGRGWLGHPDLDPTFRRYAKATERGEVSVWRVGTSPSDPGDLGARLPGLGHFGVSLEWSPDGRHLGVRYWALQRLQVWRVDEPTPTLVLDEKAGNRAFGFTTDGRLLSADGTVLRVSDLETGKTVRTLPFAEPVWDRIVANPRLPLAVVSTQDKVLLVDLATGKTPLRIPVTAQSSLAWHPDGELFALACEPEIRVWDAARRRQNWLLEHRGGGVSLTFNQAGDLLVSCGWAGRTKYWNPHTGRELFGTSGDFVQRFGPGDRMMRWREVERGEGNALSIERFEAGREYRALIAGPGRGVREYWRCGVHPGGRLLAVGTLQGLSFMDLAAGSERAFLPLATTNTLFEPSGTLLTNSSAGLYRWPVRADPAAPHRFRIGPPEPISVPLPALTSNIGCSADGAILAGSIPGGGGAYTWHRDRPHAALYLTPHGDCRSVAVSPDGKLVATGSHSGYGLGVWDSRTGKPVRSLLPDSKGTTPFFSPDGRRLFNSDGRNWRTADWSEGPRHPGNWVVAFTPGGELAAWGGQKGFASLVETETGRVLARLEDPHQDAFQSLAFSPDGTRLIGTTNDSTCVRVWDLRLIRRGLVELGLDWDAPAYPPAKVPPPGNPRREPLQVEIVGAETLPGMPKPSALALNNEAWRLVNGPVDERNPAKALLLIRRAVEGEPANPLYRNTLGVALYRVRQFGEAIPELEKSLAGGKGHHDAFDLYFLAMCHARLGGVAKARECFARAGKWVESQKNLPPPWPHELEQFRAEAEAVLREAKTPEPTPRKKPGPAADRPISS